jgi:hypothetical protein
MIYLSDKKNILRADFVFVYHKQVIKHVIIFGTNFREGNR